MRTALVPVGAGTLLARNHIVRVLAAESAPTKRLVVEGWAYGLVLDLTGGRRTQAVALLDDGHVALLAVPPARLQRNLLAARMRPPRTVASAAD